jgi:hypothetical protein
MKIRTIKETVTKQELQDMLEELQSYVKLAVDVERGVLAGGGEYHADCEEVLLADGSRQEDIWGADWYPESKSVRFEALINIRPNQDNPSMEIQNRKIREDVEQIVKHLFLGKKT